MNSGSSSEKVSLPWIKGINKSDLNNVLILNKNPRTRNEYKVDELDEPRFKKERGENWFSNRAVDEWNKLSKSSVERNTTGFQMEAGQIQR